MRFLILLFAALPLSAQITFNPRPRVDVNPAKLARLRAMPTGTAAQQAQYAALKAWVQGVWNGSTYPYQSATALVHLIEPGAAYQGKTYGRRACEMIHEAIGLPSGHLYPINMWKNTNSFRTYHRNIIRAYDWTYDVCTAEERAETEAWILKSVDAAWNWSSYISGLYFEGSAATWSLFNGNNSAGGLALTAQAAVALGNGSWLTSDPRNFGTNYGGVIGRIQAQLKVCTENSTAAAPFESCNGGAWSEGNEYDPEAKYLYLEALESLRLGTNYDPWPEVPSFADSLLNFHIAATSPAGVATPNYLMYEPWPFRDVQKPGQFYVADRSLTLRLLEYFRSSGQTEKAAKLKWFMDTRNPLFFPSLGGNMSQGESLWQDAFWYDPSESGTDYTSTEPRDFITPFMLLSRSDWSADATWVGVMGMRGSFDHTHGDDGKFQIYRKGKWLTRSVPVYMSRVDGNYGGHNWSSNSPILNWHGTFHAGRGAGSPPSDWSRLTRTANGYRAGCGTSGIDYCHAQVDMTGGYRITNYTTTPDVQSAYRDFLYLKPDIIVVADRVKYADGLNALTFSPIQAMEESPAVIEGNRAMITSGGQRLHINVVEPVSPQIKAVTDDVYHVVGATKISDDEVNIYVDGPNFWSNGTSVVLSGATGEWAAINGAWAITKPASAQTFPYADGSLYNLERYRITGTGAFSGITTAWPASLSSDVSTSQVKTSYIPTPYYRVDISSGEYRNSDNQLLVMQAADDGVEPLPVTRGESASMAVAEVAGMVIAVPRSVDIPDSMSYSHGAGATDPVTKHFVLGLWPSTAYIVDQSVPGLISIAATDLMADNTVMSTAAGLLYFETFREQQNEALKVASRNSKSVVLRYGWKGLSARTQCTVELSQDSQFQTVVATRHDDKGPAIRFAEFGGSAPLLPDTLYFARATCGAEQRISTFRTRPGGSASATAAVRLGGHHRAQLVRVEYGPTPQLGNSVESPCEGGCTLNLPVTRDGLLYMKVIRRNNLGAVVATSRAQVIAP